MLKSTLHLLLADDDRDDCLFFEEALNDLPVDVSLTTVNDGVSLMDLLSISNSQLPDILFLDLNMPRKSGLDCLLEIRAIKSLRGLKIVIFTTSFDIQTVNLLYNEGADYFIRKPGDFSALKKVILRAISLTTTDSLAQPARDKFVLGPK